MKKDRIKLIKITKLKNNNKKYSAEFEVIKASGKISKKTTKFGAAGMSDFTIHKDTERRERYISRHKKDLKTGNPTRAGFLSMYILWNKPSFSASVSDYKRRLNTYNKTGKFPTKIAGSKLLNSFGISIGNSFGNSFRNMFGSPRDLEIKNIDKITLKKYLIKIKDENKKKQNVPLDNVLDIDDMNTYYWLVFANKILKPTDLKGNTLWAKVLLNLLKELDDYRPYDNPYFTKKDLEIVDKIVDEIEELLSKLDIRFDFDEHSGNWARLAYHGLEELNMFGIKNRKLRFGIPGASIPFEDTSLRVLPEDIQKIIKKESIKKSGENMDKLYLKNYLRNVRSKNVNMRNTDLNMILNPLNQDTVVWLRLAYNILKKNDFKNDPLWSEILIFLLYEIIAIEDQNTNNLTVIERELLELNIALIDALVKKIFNIDIDFTDYENWAQTTIDSINEMIQDGNYFGITKRPNKSNMKELAKIPDNVVNKPLYLRIKNKIKKEIGNKRRWGAYDSGRLVREYKAKGGKYSGKGTKNNSKKNQNSDLSRWYREKWIDACAWPKRKSCGRDKATIKSKVTYCRPSVRVDKNTPKTIKELSKKQIKDRCKRKSKSPKKIIRK